MHPTSLWFRTDKKPFANLYAPRMRVGEYLGLKDGHGEIVYWKVLRIALVEIDDGWMQRLTLGNPDDKVLDK